MRIGVPGAMEAVLAIVMLVVLCLAGGCRQSGAGGAGANSLVIKGSDTMLPLVNNWAEAYMHGHPGTSVSVTGGGSGTGIAALLNKTTDIAAASRALAPEERRTAANRGVKPVETTVARDGITLVVNRANPVKALTLEQLRLIYTGKISNWQQVGGRDQPILLFSRESSSGTYVFFQEHVLKKADYAASARLLPATSAIIQAVASDPTAIGYVGLGYARASTQVKVLAVKASPSARAVAPSEATVKNGSYPIARPLYLYTNGPPAGIVHEFIAFALSPSGQQIVRQSGYITVQ